MVFGEIVGGPLLAGLSIFTAVAASTPDDPCKAPAIRLESANLAALPGPHSPACKAAKEKAARKGTESKSR